jgi:hypothetical protein
MAHEKSVSDTDAAVLTVAPTQDQMQRYPKEWWRHRHLRALNLWMLIPLLSIFAQG